MVNSLKILTFFFYSLFLQFVHDISLILYFSVLLQTIVFYLAHKTLLNVCKPSFGLQVTSALRFKVMLGHIPCLHVASPACKSQFARAKEQLVSKETGIVDVLKNLKNISCQITENIH